MLPNPFARWMMILALLIAYASLYPFEFRLPPAFDWQAFVGARLVAGRSLADILGNIGLFMPMGALAVLRARTASAPWRWLGGLLLGTLVLALSIQGLQTFVVGRDPALADVAWNALGILMGMPAGALAERLGWLDRAALPVRSPARVLLLAWLLAELLPLVPTFELDSVTRGLKPLLLHPALSMPDLVAALATGLLVGELLAALRGPVQARVELPALLLAALVLKILMVEVDVTLSLVIGWAAASTFWPLLAIRPPTERQVGIAILLLLAITLQALSPYRWGDAPSEFRLLPLKAFLDGNMLMNVQVFMRHSVLYAGLLWLAVGRARHMVVLSALFAAWLLLLELLQTRLEGRVASIDDPLLMLLLGWLFAQLQALGGARSTAVELRTNASVPADIGAAYAQLARRAALVESAKESEFPGPRRRPDAWGWASLVRSRRIGVAVLTLAAVAGIAAVLQVGLRLPGLPYNVRELFIDDGEFFSLALFALATLWIGLGAWLGGRWAAASRRPYLVIPMASLGAAVLSLALLSLSVTQESLSDIAGSNNLYWWATNRDLWGPWWAKVFPVIGPEVVGFLERIVRYAAIYSPLAAILAGVTAVWLRGRYDGLRVQWLGPAVLGLYVWLWVCRTVAFDWSSTDNLNELIARAPPFGIAGEWYLYLLLGVLAINTLLPLLSATGFRSAVTTLSVTVIGAGVGWLLLNMGLEADVRKYGMRFPAVQFLLGPDRRSLLTEEALFLRWVVVYVGLLVVITTGLKLGQLMSPFAPRRQRANGAPAPGA